MFLYALIDTAEAVGEPAACFYPSGSTTTATADTAGSLVSLDSCVAICNRCSGCEGFFFRTGDSLQVE
jgi:hypothetical protein